MKYNKSNNNILFNGLKQRVDLYFRESGQSSYGNRSLLMKSLAVVFIYLLANASVYFLPHHDAFYAIAYIISGISGVMIVFNIVHDASHQAVFKQKKYNRLLCKLGDLAGINTYIWNIRHNVQHHAFTNILGGDLIIEHIPLIRLSPHQPYYRHHRYQAFYAPVLYMFYSLYWIFVIDFKLFFKKEICNLKDIHHKPAEWVQLFFFKSLYVFYALIAPALFTPLSAAESLAFFLLMHIAAGTLLSGVALLGHFVEGPSFPEADEHGGIDNSWGQHQLEATIDFAPCSRFIHLLSGGLNTHVAHHLFPKICHIHYYALTPIIRQYCLDHGVEYKSESLGAAFRSHIAFLQRLSVP